MLQSASPFSVLAVQAALSPQLHPVAELTLCARSGQHCSCAAVTGPGVPWTKENYQSFTFAVPDITAPSVGVLNGQQCLTCAVELQVLTGCRARPLACRIGMSLTYSKVAGASTKPGRRHGPAQL